MIDLVLIGMISVIAMFLLIQNMKFANELDLYDRLFELRQRVKKLDDDLVTGAIEKDYYHAQIQDLYKEVEDLENEIKEEND